MRYIKRRRGRMRCCAKWGDCSHHAGPLAPSCPPRPSRRSSSPPAEVISTVGLLHTFCDSAISTVPEKLADTTDSHVAEVGVDAQQIPAPGEQHKQGRDCERRHERARKTAQRREKMEPNGSGRSSAVPPSLRNRLQLAHPPPTRRAPPPAAARPSPAPGPNRRNHAISAAAGRR